MRAVKTNGTSLGANWGLAFIVACGSIFGRRTQVSRARDLRLRWDREVRRRAQVARTAAPAGHLQPVVREQAVASAEELAAEREIFRADWADGRSVDWIGWIEWIGRRSRCGLCRRGRLRCRSGHRCRGRSCRRDDELQLLRREHEGPSDVVGKQRRLRGDLTFGQANGLAGADEICRRAAEMGLRRVPATKTGRAFLSVTQGPGGMPVHARDRIGKAPGTIEAAGCSRRTSSTYLRVRAQRATRCS